MFPATYTDFTSLFAEILDLATTLQLTYVLAAGAIIGLLGATVRTVRRAAR